MVLNSLNVQHIVGSLAGAGCLAVILTYLKFRDLRSLRYIELVFYVSLNDMIASVGLALGGSKTGSAICYFQAIVTNLNYLAAIFWTTIIAYQMWLAVHYNETIRQDHMLIIHIICWGLPTVLTLLPLTTNNYGNADDESTWCFIDNRAHSPSWGLLFWDIFAFYAWIWLAILIDFYFIFSSWAKIRTLPTNTSKASQAVASIKMKVTRLVAYPMIIFICWGICSVADIYFLQHSGETLDIEATATLFSGLQGLLMSLVFFLVNPMVVYKWKAFFTRQAVYFNKDSNRFTLGSATVAGASLYMVEDEPDYVDPRDSFWSVNNSVASGQRSTREEDRNRFQYSVENPTVQFSTFATMDTQGDTRDLGTARPVGNGGGGGGGGGAAGRKSNGLSKSIVNNPIVRESEVFG